MELECHGLDTPERICFYEHDYYPLSTFSSFTLFWKNIRFDTLAAAYHWEKFDYEDSKRRIDLMLAQEAIRKAPSAHDAFYIAQRYKAIRRADWDDVKVDIMRSLLIEKIKQHEYVRRKLLATGTSELVGSSWCDDVLGKLWMELRTMLQDNPLSIITRQTTIV